VPRRQDTAARHCSILVPNQWVSGTFAPVAHGAVFRTDGKRMPRWLVLRTSRKTVDMQPDFFWFRVSLRIPPAACHRFSLDNHVPWLFNPRHCLAGAGLRVSPPVFVWNCGETPLVTRP